jgi:hypothetical protein
MILQFYVLFFGVIAIIFNFHSVFSAWIWIGLLDLEFIFKFLRMKRNKIFYIPELSTTANNLLNKYSYYYESPTKSRDLFTGSLSIVFPTIILTIINVFQAYYFCIILGVLNFYSMYKLSLKFEIVFNFTPEQKNAHD